ncbi:MAG: energy-coupling factor transporter ATPase [Eubacteriales bacterium]|nr:energy-coupling factor transporter ATPase [Eubacteriales bacterium]
MQERQYSAVTVENAVYSYPESDIAAVSGASMTVPKGALVAVLGHNGSGKSTLAKMLNGLYCAQSGKVSVCGIDAAVPENAWDVRSHCGMVFQNPDNQIVSTVVEEDVAFGLENIGMEPAKIRTRVAEALEMVGMSDYALAAPHMLSGGQKQRVAIAGVLAMRCEVIVFDEATAMLDPSGREEIFQIVRRLNREEGVTVIWITHFMEEAVQADYIYIMDEGKTVARGTAREVFSDSAALRGYGLDVPVAAEFSEALRGMGVAMPEGILTAEEAVEALCRSV